MIESFKVIRRRQTMSVFVIIQTAVMLIDLGIQIWKLLKNDRT